MVQRTHAGADQLLRRLAFHEGARICQPGPKHARPLIAVVRRARLVAQLPGHDGGVLVVWDAGVGVHMAGEEGHMGAPHGLSHITGVELPRHLLVLAPVILTGARVRHVLEAAATPVGVVNVGHARGTQGVHPCRHARGRIHRRRVKARLLLRPAHILDMSPGPRPFIAKNDCSPHSALAHLSDEVIKAVQHVRVVDPRAGLQAGHNAPRLAVGPFGGAQDAQLGDPHRSKGVEASHQAAAVAAGPGRAQGHAIPQVGAYVVPGDLAVVVKHEVCPVHSDEPEERVTAVGVGHRRADGCALACG